MDLPGIHQQTPDCDIWAHEHFSPSWFCLPNNQTALTVVRPGDTARDTLEQICKVRPLGWCLRGVGSPRLSGCSADSCDGVRPPGWCLRGAVSPWLSGQLQELFTFDVQVLYL